MLDTIHNLNDSDFPGSFVLVTFYVARMFPSIDDERDIKAVKKLQDLTIFKTIFGMQ